MPLYNPIFDQCAPIIAIRRISHDVSIIALDCPEIAQAAAPGNFVNVKVGNTTEPLLRRPFSIHRVHGGGIELMVREIGKSTAALCGLAPGTTVQVLGPLGNSFSMEGHNFRTAVLVSGGIGTAPMRFLQDRLLTEGKTLINLIGGRTAADLYTTGLEHCLMATDDGSAGMHGNVVELLGRELPGLLAGGPLKVFSCGPMPMLKALAAFCRQKALACDLSLETVMGCGFGICYGCSIEVNDPEKGKRSMLLCKEGPVIDAALLAL